MRFSGFCSSFDVESILVLPTSKFIFCMKFLIFRHPTHPWVRFSSKDIVHELFSVISCQGAALIWFSFKDSTDIIHPLNVLLFRVGMIDKKAAMSTSCHYGLSLSGKPLTQNMIQSRRGRIGDSPITIAFFNLFFFNPKRCGGGGGIHPTLRRLAAISQGMIQMFSNFLTFSRMMLGPR